MSTNFDENAIVLSKHLDTVEKRIKRELNKITSGGLSNVVTGITIDGVLQSGDASGVVALNLTDYAKKTDVAGAYYTKGSVSSFVDLPATGNTNGDVYNILTAGGTDRHGTTIGAGTNVVYVEDTETPANSGWDALGGFTDISGKVDKVTSAVSGNVAAWGANGVLVDSGHGFATDADIAAMLIANFGEETTSGGNG